MAQNGRKQFQQSFNIVDMSNIHGKHVQSVKTCRNLIRGIVFLTNTASVTDVFEIIALMPFSPKMVQTFLFYVCVWSLLGQGSQWEWRMVKLPNWRHSDVIWLRSAPAIQEFIGSRGHTRIWNMKVHLSWTNRGVEALQLLWSRTSKGASI